MRRTELQDYRKAKADELVNLNTSVALLKEQLELVREESRASDAGRSTRAAATSAYKLEHGQVRIMLCGSGRCTRVHAALAPWPCTTIKVAA